MFRNIIATSPLTDEMSNPAFPHITGESFQGDTSMVATLRALIAHRMGDDNTIHVVYRTSNNNETAFTGCTKKQISDVVVGDPCPPDTIKIISVRGTTDSIKMSFDAVLECVPEMDGYVKLESPTAYFRGSLNMHCFINANTRSVLVFVETLDVRKLHLIQMATLTMLPWYFDKSKGISDIEMELIKSLSEREPDHYMATLAEIAKDYDFRTPRIRSLLFGFESRFERLEKDRIAAVISDIDIEIKSLEGRIHELCGDRRDNEIRLFGLTCKLDSVGDESEIMDYFLCNKKIHLRSVCDDYFEFIVGDYMTYFDVDLVERTINNRNSYFYTGRSASDDKMKKLLTAIFIDQSIKVRLFGCYRLCLDGHVEGVRMSYEELPSELKTYMPNTHVNRYECLGNNKEAIRKCCRSGNYIGAIEQCVASCKSMNIGDSTVMASFTEELLCGGYSHNKGFELPDGRLVDHNGAIEWLLEQEEANGKTGKKEEA